MNGSIVAPLRSLDTRFAPLLIPEYDVRGKMPGTRGDGRSGLPCIFPGKIKQGFDKTENLSGTLAFESGITLAYVG